MQLRSLASFPRLATAFALLAAGPLQAASLVGEWNLDATACEQARIAYTADGRHQSLQRGDDGWTTSASGSYTLDGERLEVEFQGQRETLEVVSLDDTTLVLRNADPEVRSAAGVEQVRFVRCPAR